jgi:hypothetical protein
MKICWRTVCLRLLCCAAQSNYLFIVILSGNESEGSKTLRPCHFDQTKCVEKSCDFSRIHSHVILEALAEEVRGSTLFTTFLPLPAAKISRLRLKPTLEMTRIKNIMLI